LDVAAKIKLEHGYPVP